MMCSEIYLQNSVYDNVIHVIYRFILLSCFRILLLLLLQRKEKGKNIYVQKQFRYYDRDKIYLIKPNQKRFWTRSQAIDDALSLIVEIANLGTK